MNLLIILLVLEQNGMYIPAWAMGLAWVMLAVIGLITLFLFATKRFWVYEGGL